MMANASTLLRSFLFWVLIPVSSAALAASTTPTPVPTVSAPPVPSAPSAPSIPELQLQYDLKVPYEIEIGEVDGVQKLFATDKKAGKVAIADIVTLPKGTKLYHWGDNPSDEEKSVARWISQGFVDEGEEAYFIKNGTGAVGGGVYASTDPLDSMTYGLRLAIFDLQKDVTIIDHFPKEYDATSLPWRELIPILQEKGIHAIKGYFIGDTDTWMNIIQSDMLTHVREGSAEEILSAKRPHPIDLALDELVQLSNRYPISPGNSYFKNHFPEIGKLMRGTPLSPSEMATLEKSNFVDLFLSPYSSISRSAKDNDLVLRLSKVLRGPIIKMMTEQGRQAVESFADPQASSVLGSTVIPYQMGISKDFGVPIEEWLPGVKSPAHLFNAEYDLATVVPQQEYGKKLVAALEIMDLRTLLSAISQGDSEPWKRAEAPGSKAGIENWIERNPNFVALDSDSYFKSRGMPAAETRDQPAVSSGEIEQGGKTYSKMSEAQKLWLEKNPLLLVESIETSEKSSDGQKIYLVRYEHPSAANFERFSAMLSVETLGALRKAEKAGSLQMTTSPEFRSLTQAMLREIEQFATKWGEWSNGNGLRRYQLWMALRPLKAGNADAARWMTQGSALSRPPYPSGTISKDPFIHPTFLDWENDWKLPFPDLVLKADEGGRQYQNVLAGLLKAEQQSPQMPRYFDVPELWEVALQQRATPGQEARFVEQAKARFKAGVLPDSTLVNPCAASYQGIGR